MNFRTLIYSRINGTEQGDMGYSVGFLIELGTE
jgi:hypothetical protein